MLLVVVEEIVFAVFIVLFILITVLVVLVVDVLVILVVVGVRIFNRLLVSEFVNVERLLLLVLLLTLLETVARISKC